MSAGSRDGRDANAELVGFIRRVLNLRDERRQITADIAEVMKEAADSGFDKARIGEVCRRIERAADKGLDLVQAEETLREIYIEAWDGAEQGAAFAKATKDEVLLALIAKPAPPPAPTKKTKTLERLRAEAAAARRARGDGPTEA